jgi:hypothetical protein
LSTVKTIGRKPERPDSSSINAVKLFIRSHNETLSIAAMRVRNPDRSPVGISGYELTGNAATLPAYTARMTLVPTPFAVAKPSADTAA